MVGHQDDVGLEHLPHEERLSDLGFSAFSKDDIKGSKQQPASTEEDVTKKMELGSLLRCTAGDNSHKIK